jgi:hypothetical protein
MKTPLRLLIVVGCLAAVAAGFLLWETDKDEEHAPPRSVHSKGELAPANMPALAKIDFQQALAAALAAAPGSVIQAALEVEDGMLMYSFEIVGADKTITEVEIDSGTGKVLATDKESGEKKDEKPVMKSKKKGKNDDREDAQSGKKKEKKEKDRD